MVARVGQRLLEGVARTMMDRFYACLPKQAEQGPEADARSTRGAGEQGPSAQRSSVALTGSS